MYTDRYQIQVREGGRWLAWDRAGGGDAVLFANAAVAREAALATGELAGDDEGVRWRVAELDAWGWDNPCERGTAVVRTTLPAYIMIVRERIFTLPPGAPTP